MNWSVKIKCPSCEKRFEVAEEDISYADLRPPHIFIPDYQFYHVCSLCGYTVIINNIPSSTALKIQNNFAKNEKSA
jgi:predicted nucleic-acid-binding Zn-ribbon protein